MYSLRVWGVSDSTLKDFGVSWEYQVESEYQVFGPEVCHLGRTSWLLIYKKTEWRARSRPQLLISATRLTWADLMSWERAQWSSAWNRDPGGSCVRWPAVTCDPDAEDDDWVTGLWVTSFVVCKAVWWGVHLRAVSGVSAQTPHSIWALCVQPD